MNEPFQTQPPVKSSFLKRVLIGSIIIIIAIALFGHLLLPLLGVTIALTAAAWLFLIISIVLFSGGILLFFLIPGIIILLFCLGGFIWLLIALALFPFFLPILLPLFIVMIVMAIMRRKY